MFENTPLQEILFTIPSTNNLTLKTPVVYELADTTVHWFEALYNTANPRTPGESLYIYIYICIVIYIYIYI